MFSKQIKSVTPPEATMPNYYRITMLPKKY
jgi:hypothetical protein